MAPRQLREYWITVSFQIEAHNEEEANEIGKALLYAAKQNVPFKVLGGEVTEIEEA